MENNQPENHTAATDIPTERNRVAKLVEFIQDVIIEYKSGYFAAVAFIAGVICTNEIYIVLNKGETEYRTLYLYTIPVLLIGGLIPIMILLLLNQLEYLYEVIKKAMGSLTKYIKGRKNR